jgi:hypothetical protein
MVPYQELELSVGDIFHVGDTTVTVIDIENGEVTFRIDEGDMHDAERIRDFAQEAPLTLPR